MASEAPGHDRYMVPTNDLAAIVVPVLEEAAARYERSNMQHDMDAGPHVELIFRMSRYLGQAETSVPRRIYSIRTRETSATGLDLADALLLCIGKRLDEVDLPVFPANLMTAREMVKSRCPRMPKEERDRLAQSLHRFAQAYVETAADDRTLEWQRDQNAKRKERDKRHRLELEESRGLYAETAA